MPFIHDPKNLSAHDQDTGATISESLSAAAEDVDQVTYMLKQDDLRCFFDIVTVDTYTEDEAKPRGLLAWAKKKPAPGGFITYVLEETLREGLEAGLKHTGQNLTEAKVNNIKSLLAEGLYALKNEGQGDTTARKHEIRFENDLAAIAALHPGKLLKYEQWMKAVGDSGKPND